MRAMGFFTALVFFLSLTAVAAVDSNQIAGDCSTIVQTTNQGGVQVGFTSTLDNGVGPNGHLHVEVVYPGLGWISWGYSQSGDMVPGFAVVGVPGSPGSLPVKYSMTAQSSSGVLPMASSMQTLGNGSVEQNATHTVMSFSKRLIEDQELTINGQGSNNFLLAWGSDNSFGYHFNNRLKFPFTLKSCVSVQTTNAPVPIASAPPSVAPIASPQVAPTATTTAPAVTATTTTAPTAAPFPAPTATAPPSIVAPTAAAPVTGPTGAAPVVAPITAPVGGPAPTPVTSGSSQIIGDCSKIQQRIKLQHVQLGITSVLDNNVGPNGNFHVEVVYSGQGWVAFGYSENGTMVPGYAVVGVPGYVPTEFAMTSKTGLGVVGMGDQYQTLTDQSITYNGTHTIMKFTKRLIEDQKLAINGQGSNDFLLAWGDSNTFGYHGLHNRASFQYDVKSCVNNPTSAPSLSPNAAPSPAPAKAPTAVPKNKNQIVGDCSGFVQSIKVSRFLVGFTSTLDHGVGPNGYLHVQVIYAGLGWLSWGYSSSGAMVPGYAVVGVPGYFPTEFNMNERTASGIQGVDSAHQTLKNHSVYQNGTHTILTLSKRLIEDTKLDIVGDGSNFFLLAWGDDNTFGYHGPTNRLSFPYTLKSCINGESLGSPSADTISVSTSAPNKKLWKAHGFFTAIAWGILAPFAIGASLLRRIFISSDLPALWFKIHMSLNMLVFVFTTMGFVFAVRAVSLEVGVRHFRDVKHRSTGLTIMVLVFAQAMSGLLRPHLPKQKRLDDEEQAELEQPEQSTISQNSQNSQNRAVWEAGHRLMGYSVVIFAWWQVQDGLGRFSTYYGDKDLSGVFWGVTGAIVGITFIVYVLHFKYC